MKCTRSHLKKEISINTKRGGDLFKDFKVRTGGKKSKGERTVCWGDHKGGERAIVWKKKEDQLEVLGEVEKAN